MPISATTIAAYLNRPVDNLAWVKTLTPADVELELSLVKPPVTFSAPLRIDQKVCFLLGAAYPEIILMTDLGLGKTVVSLELFNYFFSIGLVKRGIVFAPTDELVEGWEDEIKKWKFRFRYVVLKGSSVNKWEQLRAFKGGGLIIGTYAGIGAMVSELKPALRYGKPTGKKKRSPQTPLLERLGVDVDAVFFDQSTCVANSKSLSFKVAHFFSRRAKVRFGLAGKAFGRDPDMLWAQFYLADHGKALGRDHQVFIDAFYSKFRPKWGGVKYNFRKKLNPQLARFIAASSLRYSTSECVDLPPKVYVKKECDFPSENSSYYSRLKAELIESRGNYREVKNAFIRMRQISSGYVGFIDDETGDRAQIEFAVNPKLNLLMDIVHELPEDKKCVIFYEFTFSGRRISEELKKAKLPHGWLWSETKDWTKIKDAFNNDPKYRFLVANWRKASMGLNLQVGSYMIFYESPVAVIPRSESEGRIHRTGQQHKCFIYDLVMKDSMDQHILDFHREGGDLWRALIDNPQRLLK